MTKTTLQASAEELEALSRRLVAAQESERQRFSRALHDLFGQNLTALGINLDIVRSQLGGTTEALKARLDNSIALLEATSAALESLMSELRPPMLDDYGLLPALEWYGEAFSRRTGIETRVTAEGRDGRLPVEREIALFRVAQEALANAARHAQPRRIDISLRRVDGYTLMSVADDGAGFDLARLASGRGTSRFGMLSMRERAQAIGGRLEVESAPGCGTRITVEVPA